MIQRLLPIRRTISKAYLLGLTLSLLAVSLPPGAKAAQTTVSINGTVGGALAFDNARNQKINLAGQPFTVTFTFDDADGQSVDAACDPASDASCSSSFTASSGNHSTARLQIGKLSFLFGRSGVNRVFASRSVPVPSSLQKRAGQLPAELDFEVTDSLGQINFKLLIPPGTISVEDADWTSPLSTSSFIPTSGATPTTGLVTLCTTPGANGADCSTYINASLIPTSISPYASQTANVPQDATGQAVTPPGKASSNC